MYRLDDCVIGSPGRLREWGGNSALWDGPKVEEFRVRCGFVLPSASGEKCNLFLPSKFVLLVCLQLSIDLPHSPSSYSLVLAFFSYLHRFSQRRNAIAITNHQVVGEDDAAPEDKVLGASDFDHLSASIHRKIHQKRTLARLPLVLSQPSSSDAASGSSGAKGGAANVPTVSIQMKLVRKCCRSLSISLSRMPHVIPN